MATDDAFSRWWVSRKGRPPLLEEAEEFATARALFEELVPPRLPVPAPEEEKTYRDGYRDCAEEILTNLPPMFNHVWLQWAEQFMPQWSRDQESEPVELLDRNEQVRPSFRVLRNEDNDAFIVSRMRAGSKVAVLEDVDQEICRIQTEAGSNTIMRKDYRAAEAFAAMLTALPDLIYVQHSLERYLGGRPPLSRPALPETPDDA